MRMRVGAVGPVEEEEPIRLCYAIVVPMLVLHDINSRLDARLGVDQLCCLGSRLGDARCHVSSGRRERFSAQACNHISAA